MCVETSMPAMSLAQMRVLAWLRDHQDLIVAAELRFRVDRRAIAGAIAWEALFNVRDAWDAFFGRFVGPGKAHVREDRFWISNDGTLVRQVEDISTALPVSERIPRVSHGDRVSALRTPDGAVTYMAAAMNVAARMAEDPTFPKGALNARPRPGIVADIRKRPEVLTFFWQKKDLNTWGALLAKKRQGEDFKTGPDPKIDMDKWVAENLDFLEDAVGCPAF